MRLYVAVYLGTLAAMLSLVTAGGVVLYHQTGSSNQIEAIADEHSYNLVSYELRHFPEKWLYKIGAVFRTDDGESDDAGLQRYFSLGEQVQQAEQDGRSDDARSLRDERAGIQRRV